MQKSKKKLLQTSTAALSFYTNVPNDSIVPAASSFDVVGIAPSFISLEDERYWLEVLGRMTGKTAMAAAILSDLLSVTVTETGRELRLKESIPVINPYLFSKRRKSGITITRDSGTTWEEVEPSQPLPELNEVDKSLLENLCTAIINGEV